MKLCEQYGVVDFVLLSQFNWLYAQLNYFLNFSQLLVSCLPLLAKLINSGVSDYCCHDY